MKQINTRAIVLARTDYGEADRILTLLTPDNGKLSLIAKGVRRIKSKLAGGIELFSISDITYIRGRGEVGTLVSTRLIRHYGTIVGDIGRTMLGYECIRLLHKATEDAPEEAYFDLLEQTFATLDDPTIDTALIRLWFLMQLLRMDGHTPNLRSDTAGDKLDVERRYAFSFDDMTFMPRPDGAFGASEIKFLRVGFAGTGPAILQKITGAADLAAATEPLVRQVGALYLRM